MKERGKLFIRDLLATALASLIVTVLLAIVVPWVPLLLAMPVNALAIKIGSWIPRGGGWLEGMADYVLAIHAFALFEIWIVFFVLVRLIRIQINRREKHGDPVSLQLK
jgi:hypothetical protein